MFRTQANPMDDAIVKATDENLVNENWEFILDVCDRVAASPSGPQQAVASLIKRLAHRNANVQLYTLELANALSQNCGPALHRELASRAFTEALLRLAGDRNTHGQVKQKVMERMEAWTEDFGKSPDFGIMGDAYRKLRTTQPSLQPPSKPGKREISHEDRKKEDDELQMALALSVQDNPRTKVNGTVSEDGDPPAQAAAGATQAQGTTAATVSRVRALYDFTPSEAGELAFRKNDIIAVLESVYKDWWKGSLRGQTGIFPLNYVEKLQDPTKDELERDAQMEAEVFGEIKNVERLLALLSVQSEGTGARRGEREEEEISELYQRTLSIRPKLIELIGKYSQKKDDFTQLNEKFIKARRDYEALLESSMTQPQSYQQYPVRQRPGGQMYAQQYQQQAPAGYPPQGPQPGYGAPYASQPQLPPQVQQAHQQDPAQRFYSPAPQDPGNQAGYNVSPYTPASGSGQPPGGPAAFHFIPGGIQVPGQEQNTAAVRRKPSPQVMGQQPPAAAPSEMGGVAAAYNAPNTFQGQIRPGSIHTLNSGNPQELAGGGYESPIDNRRSYPPAALAAQQPPQQAYDYQRGQTHDGYQQAQTHDGYQQGQAPQAAYSSFPHLPQQVQSMHPQSAVPAPLHPQQRNDLSSLPSRQRTQSFESSNSLYSMSQAGAEPGISSAPQPGYAPPPAQSGYASSAQPHQRHAPPQPLGAPPGVPSSPPMQHYQAYQPNMPPQRAPVAPAGDDPGDFYR